MRLPTFKLKQSALAALLSCAAFAVAQNPLITIDSGKIEGSVADGIAAFKGIPYATPPLGNLRWRAPQPVKRWTGVRPATMLAHDCMQNPFVDDQAPPIPPVSEDCLYLNVLTPAAKPATPMPVMVWVHGGGSVIGGTTPKAYQGEAFVKHGVIFVSINYRLGRLGYFAHPALTAENADGMLGNYGYMDQIAALKWVQRNIAAFGGDKNNVTVMGESHGGRSMHMLLGTSLAKGLFARVIIESGFGRMYQPPISIPMGDGAPSAEQIGVKWAASVGVQGTDTAALAKLRALPAQTAIGNIGYGGGGRENYTGPMIDGKLVPADTPNIYLSGDNQRVPILLGGNDEDTGTAAGATEDEVYASFGLDADKARTVYKAWGVKDLATLKATVGRDRTVLEPARFEARIFAFEGLPVYEFRFSYVAESLRNKWTGAHHATEVPYVFKTLNTVLGDKVTAKDQQVEETMIQYWTNFMKTGDPNGAGLPVWPRYSPSKDELMNFTAAGTPVEMPDEFKARLDLVEHAASGVAAEPRR